MATAQLFPCTTRCYHMSNSIYRGLTECVRIPPQHWYSQNGLLGPNVYFKTLISNIFLRCSWDLPEKSFIGTAALRLECSYAWSRHPKPSPGCPVEVDPVRAALPAGILQYVPFLYV